MKKYTDVYIGVVLIIIALIIIVMSNPLPSESAVFPRIVAGIMIFLSLILTFNGLKSSKSVKDESESTEKIFMKDVLKGAAIMILYLVLMPILGYFTATTLFIVLFMVAYNEKSVRKILTTVVILNVFIYMIFVAQLNVPLPQGLLM